MSTWRAGLLIGISCCSTATWASNIPAVTFFRSPQSLFSSGQAPLVELEKEKRAEITQNFYQVSKDHHDFKLPAGFVVRDLDVSRQVIDKKTGLKGTLLRAAAPWYQYQDANGVTSWKLADQLAPLPYDLGLAFVFTPHAWRKKPDWKSESMGDVSFGQRLRVLGIQGEFVQVADLADSHKVGFVELSHVILKIDFASFVTDAAGPWHSFSFRADQNAILTDQKKQPLSQITGMITRTERGIVNQVASEFKVSPRSIVEVTHGEWVQWAESELKGHGRVFWKKTEQTTDAKKSAEQFTTEQILKKNFYSLALHPSNPQVALVSAEGVFSTRDGQSWTKLPSFQDANLPVAIGENGDFFVGSFRSSDGGKTFQPFLRWEDLTYLLEKHQQRTLGLMTLSEVKSVGPNLVQITVGTASGKAWLRGSAKFGLVTNWKILRTE